MKYKFMQFLGIAQKTGILISGTEMVKKRIVKGKAFLIILAEDLSERVGRDFEAICNIHRVTWIRLGTKIELGFAIGKSPRGVIAVTDRHFAERLLVIFKQELIDLN